MLNRLSVKMSKRANGESERSMLAFLAEKWLGYIPKEDINRAIRTSPENLHPELILNVAIGSAEAYHRFWSENNLKQADYFLDLALGLTSHIYEATSAQGRIVFPHHRMYQETTETGALGFVIDPNKSYPTSGQTYLILKRVDDTSRGNQAYADSKHFQDGREIKLEHILANLPIIGGGSYLWKEFIVGPNLSDLLQTLDNGIIRGDREEKRLSRQFERELADISIGRLAYWQEQAPDLISVPKSSEAVITQYKRSFMEILRGFSQSTDLFYSEDDLENFRKSIDNLDWSFVKKDTVVRNLAATYKNMPILAGIINIDYSSFIDKFTENGGDKKVNRYALEQNLYFVDTSDKYSHALEDPWEMDLSIEGKSKLSAVEFMKKIYKKRGVDFTPGETQLMGAYRAYRKAYLILNKFMPRNIELFTEGAIEVDEAQEKRITYEWHIKHLLGRGSSFLDKMKEQGSLQNDIFIETLKKLSSYSRINYNSVTPQS